MTGIDINVHLGSIEPKPIEVFTAGEVRWIEVAGVTFFFRSDDKSRTFARNLAIAATQMLTSLSEDEE